MSARRRLLLSALAGLAALVGALAPITTSPAHAATEITGEPWSAPAHPVTCAESSSQITCTPEDPSAIKPQQCYLGVLHNGSEATLCSTFEGHRGDVQAAGGTQVLVGYGCSVGDVVCITFENAGRGMALGTTAMMYTVAENIRFDTTSVLWDAATGEWSFWAWAVLIVLFVAMIWSVTAAAISGDRSELMGAIVRSFVAFPATALSLWLLGQVLNAVDDLTWYVLNREGPVALFATLQEVMWAGGEANYFFGFLIHALLLLGLLLLMLVFTVRNIALAALIMVGPLAWMIFPIRGIGPQWVVRYFSAVIVLLLTAPLTIGFVTLIVNGLASTDTIWNPQAWPLLVGLVMVAFAPFAVFGLFSFVGAVAADSLGSSLGSRAGGAARTATRSAAAIPTRLGGTAAGVRARGSTPRPGPPAARRRSTTPAGGPGLAGAARPGVARSLAGSNARPTSQKPAGGPPPPPQASAPTPAGRPDAARPGTEPAPPRPRGPHPSDGRRS